MDWRSGLKAENYAGLREEPEKEDRVNSWYLQQLANVEASRRWILAQKGVKKKEKKIKNLRLTNVLRGGKEDT